MVGKVSKKLRREWRNVEGRFLTIAGLIGARPYKRASTRFEVTIQEHVVGTLFQHGSSTEIRQVAPGPM